MNYFPSRPFLASALFAVLISAPAVAAPPPEVLLMLESRGHVVSLPEHARAGQAVAGRFNATSLGASRVRVDLPNGRSLVAARVKETRGNRGDVSWAGEFEGQPGSLLVMTSHRGRVTGFLHDGADIWELDTGADGALVVFQVNEDMLPEEHDPIDVAADAEADASADADTQAVLDAGSVTAADPVVQDLLMVYTQAAINRAGSVATLESRMLNAAAAANAAYLNSHVGIRLNVVGMVRTDYVETGDIAQTLTRLSSTNDGHMDEVHKVRDQLGADLVAIVSEDSNYCGVAYVMSSPSSSFASTAFSVTKQSCFSNQTLAHEVGHNQGNSHDRANGGFSAHPYAYGYRTCDNIAPNNGQSFRTVMSYSCSGSRVNYFSNPDVYYNGAPMGVAYETNAANSADNARSMNNTAAITAAFRGAGTTTPTATAPTAPSQLQGDMPDAEQARLSWRDNSTDETGFMLQRAVNGGSFSDRASLPTGTTAFTDTGLAAGTTYSYRVRAWNSVGNSAFSNTVTLVTPTSASSVTLAPPPPPPSPASVDPVADVATVTWVNVAGENAYEARRETLHPKNGRWNATTLSIPANVTSFAETLSGGTYRYALRALNASGASEWVTAQCSSCGSDGSFVVASSGGTSGGPSNNKGGKKK